MAGPAYLIVNADDYGYFPGVSRGILATAREGVVNATGVLATSPYFAEHVPWLAACPDLDAGVHLNLTSGRPLTGAMAAALGRWHGHFPDKFALAVAVATGRIPVAAVEGEWRAQIQRCVDAGLRLYFLNSHEHVHVLPSLARLAYRLAEQFAIPFVRRPAAEWRGVLTAGGVVRNLVLHGCGWINGAGGRGATPIFLGLAQSGRIDLAYLERLFATLRPGAVYELMCHPGYPEPGEVSDPRLLAYHHWDQERAVLSGPALRERLRAQDIEPIRYRDLAVRAVGRRAMAARHQEVGHE